VVHYNIKGCYYLNIILGLKHIRLIEVSCVKVLT